jgi:hypothetical protein
MLLGAALGDLTTWQTWFAVLKAAYGERLSEVERAAFDRVAGGREPPTRKVRRFVAAVSRRSGKGRAAAALATFESALHRSHLAPGETGVVAVISPTRAQSAIVRDYTLGYFEASPILRGEIAETTADEIRLKNGCVVTTLSSDYRTLRGRTLLLAVLDEASFLQDETSSTPDIEAQRALLPGLATTGGMLVILSSPYAKRGLLYQLHRDYFGKDSSEVLVVAGPSILFNPLLDVGMIEAARSADPLAALSEWDGEFRTDVNSFLDDATLDAAVDRSRPLELSPRAGFNYVAFTDSSAGRHDAFTICVAHVENGRVIADAIQGRKPPFDPASVATDFAILAREFGCRTIVGDAFSGDWVANAFRSAGVEYQRAEKTRSEIYLECLPLFSRGLVNIPDHPQLLRELRLLERRTTRLGRDLVDHGSGGSDDYANALCGALVLAGTHRSLVFTAEMVAQVRAHPPYRPPANAWPLNRPSPQLQRVVIPLERRCYPASALPAHKIGDVQ